MIPTTRPTSCGLAPVRAVDPALDFLPSVLRDIQSASRILECGLREDDLTEREFLRRLRSTAFSISNTFHLLKIAGRHAEFVGNANAILSAVESAVAVGSCGAEFKCALWKKSYKEIYPKCHALCHLVNNDTTSSSLFSPPELSVSGGLLEWLTEFYDKLQVAYPDPESIEPPESKQHRWFSQEIFSSTCQIFHALSQCRRETVDCGVSVRPEARLALTPHLNIRDGDEHSVDVFFSLDTETPLWDEVRIHMNSLAPPSTNRDKRLAKPAVRFLEGSGKSTSKAPQWRTKKPKRFPHFCELLDPRKTDTNATHRINVTLDTNNDFWRHSPTPRLVKRDDLTHSVSLASVLASDMRNINNMVKLKLVVILGYSLLYLFDGPWLSARKATGWSRENIIFFQKDGKVMMRPFLRSNLQDDASNSSDDDVDDDDDSFHKYPVLVDFAITLLELHLGETIESYLNIAEPLTSASQKWAFANDALRMCKPFIGVDLRNAIEACLDPDLGDMKAGEGGYDDTKDENTDEHSGAEEANADRIKQVHGRIFTKIVDPLHHHLDDAFNSDNLDEEWVRLDLGSGHLVEKKETYHVARHTNSTHDQKAIHSEKSSLKNGKAIVVTAATPVTFTEPYCPIFIPGPPSRAEVGGIYTLYSDFSGSVPVSLHDAALTDGWFAKFNNLEVLSPLSAIKPGDPRRVRMAIIDTGIDMSHIVMQAAKACNRIITVCDWVNGRGGVEDFDVGDASGHGTHLASVILKMAPHVDLYIARITETHDLKDSQENIANAIRTASSKWGCAIISLSLGFKTGIPSIQRALDDAIKMNGVLVFAAASNDGANSGTAYPAKLSSVFCIYSTDSYGNPSLFNPSPTALNGDAFGIIGENVLGAWPSSPASRAVGDSLQRMSGSSIATPIAAALVACVLGLAFKWEAQNVIKLASYEGVRRVLFKMAVKRKEHLYLDPVSFFSRKESNILEDVREVLDLRN